MSATYEWLSELDPKHAALVPTRSLANDLSERVARHCLDAGLTVWRSPTIIVWSDYLRLLWQLNRRAIANAFGSHSLISSQQASLLWTQVIEASRRSETELSLLNVQQTTRAVQRSWKLLHDWQISSKDLAQDHVADTEQFLSWSNAYQAILDKRGLLDEQLLVSRLIELDRKNIDIEHPFNGVHLLSFDMLNAAQKQYFELLKNAGLSYQTSQPQRPAKSERYSEYAQTDDEIRAALMHARDCVELDSSHTVSLVIPDLAQRQTQVEELAREVFYPSASPLSMQQNNSVYAFSLGRTMADLPAIEAAISILILLKNRSNTVDIGFILRNRFLGLCGEHREQARLFEQWLKRQRIHTFSFDQVPLLYAQSLEYLAQRDQSVEGNFQQVLEHLVEQRQGFQAQLASAKQSSNYAALSFTEWAQNFADWLSLWQWRTAPQGHRLDSVQYQLEMRWKALLEEFAALTTVQSRVGLSRALELLQTMARNTVFQAKSVDSPIQISGLFEAVGREVDTCIVTGMNQDYPAPSLGDAFISKRFLIDVDHPDASAELAFLQAKRVMTSLLSCASHRCISYAKASDKNAGNSVQASALFRSASFIGDNHFDQLKKTLVPGSIPLQTYRDTRGTPWLEPGRAKGGSKIFENQSNCAFKAYATHQLGFLSEDETEFGLDGLDRGNVVHLLLDKLWERLQTKTVLSEMNEAARRALISELIEQCFEQSEFKLNNDKLSLLKHEKHRLLNLLFEWLLQEDKRPSNFSVIEREEPREAELGGIRYKYIIDRLDITDDGRTVIIDYKTGSVNRKDWTGERIRNPQMPLYALALDQLKNKSVSGIAFAQVKALDPKYIELSEQDIFRKSSRYSAGYEADWVENRNAWPDIFEHLAQDFLAGEACVNPIDENTCQYCDLQSMCRVSQLRDESKLENDEAVL